MWEALTSSVIAVAGILFVAAIATILAGVGLSRLFSKRHKWEYVLVPEIEEFIGEPYIKKKPMFRICACCGKSQKITVAGWVNLDNIEDSILKKNIAREGDHFIIPKIESEVARKTFNLEDSHGR